MAGEMLPGVYLDLLQLGQVAASLAVASTGVAYTHSFPLPRNVTFSWEVMFMSSGTITVKVELEQGNARPGTEGSADSLWCVPDNKTATPMYASVGDAVIHNVAYAPNATGFGRLKLTGLGSNDASTKLSRARMYTVKNSF